MADSDRTIELHPPKPPSGERERERAGVEEKVRFDERGGGRRERKKERRETSKY